MAVGIKISKPGFDVSNANTEDLYLDSTHPLLKVQSQGSGTITYAASDGSSTVKTATITHSLNYKPIVMAFAERAPGSDRKIVLGSTIQTTGEKVVVYSQITTTTFVLTFQSVVAVSTGDYDYYYYIFHDEIT